MEQEHLTCPSNPTLTPSCDPEVFERVWRRVMPQDRPDCPFRLRGEEETAAGETASSPEAAEESTALAIPAARTAETLPAENDVPCLGAASAVHGAQLQAFIEQALAGWRTYQLLARRAPGGGGRALSTLAADERRHAKRLSAAYFLISGVRYWPADRPAVPAIHTYPAALRSRFCAEQRGELAYRAAAEETADPALRELFLDLAQEENSHAWLIRSLVEQL